MKKILIFSLIAFFALQVSAQRLYSYQKKTSYTAAWADTVDVTLQNTYTVVTVPLDSATAINWKKSTSRLYPGDAVTFITSNATVDTILVSLCYNGATTIGTYKTAPAETKVITAVYDGTMLRVMTTGNWGTSYFTRTGTTLTTAVADDTIGAKAGNLYLSGTTSINGTLGVSGLLTTASGINLGTSKALVGTTAMTLGNNGQTIAVNSSDWDISTTGAMTGIGAITSDGAITGASVISPLYDVTGAAEIVFGSEDVTSFKYSGISEDLILTPSANAWTITTTTGAKRINLGPSIISATLYNFVPAAGVAGDSVAYTLNSTPGITISTGTKITFIVKKANIGAATLAVDGAAAADLEEYEGGTLNALDANDMIVGQAVEVLWNGSKWILISAH